MIASGVTIMLTFSSAMPILNIVNTLLNKTIQDKQFQETTEARFTPLQESQKLEASYSIQVPKEKIILTNPMLPRSLEEVI